MDIKVISRNVGYALLVSALFMFFSILVSIANGNDSALAALLISFTITFISGIFPFIFVRKSSAMSVSEGYVTIVLSWLLSFIFGMLPYALWGGPFSVINAWFESVSGFTTTGATILENVEALPNSLLFWRSSTHFIGGLGVVVFLLLIIPNTSQMKLRLTNMELSSLSKQEYKSRANKTVSIFTIVYLGLLAAAFLCYLLAGMNPFDAINHAMSVVATGGFSTKNYSIGEFNSLPITLVTMLFMLLASVHFGLIYIAIVTRSLKPFKNEVFRLYISALLLGSLLITITLKAENIDQSFGRSLLDGSFQMLSYMSTTGFAITDNSEWPVLPNYILMTFGMCCGMAGSTTGGIKSDRVLIFFKEINYHLRNVLHPNSVHEVRVNGKVLTQEAVAPHILYMALFFVVMFASMIVCLCFGVDNDNAIIGTVSCLSNVGPSIGELGTYGNYGMEPTGAKIMYTLDMFLGRVEMYPIMAVVMMLCSRREK